MVLGNGTIHPVVQIAQPVGELVEIVVELVGLALQLLVVAGQQQGLARDDEVEGQPLEGAAALGDVRLRDPAGHILQPSLQTADIAETVVDLAQRGGVCLVLFDHADTLLELGHAITPPLQEIEPRQRQVRTDDDPVLLVGTSLVDGLKG